MIPKNTNDTGGITRMKIVKNNSNYNNKYINNDHN